MQNLNNKSLNLKTMQEGGEPSLEMQEEDAINKLLEQIRLEIDKGGEPKEIIEQLLKGGMPPETVAQIFAKLGMPEDQLVPLMEQAMGSIQDEGQPQEQPQEQGQPSQEEMAGMQEAAPAQPVMQGGGEPEVEVVEPQEDIVTRNGFNYKRIIDPDTGEATYYTKSIHGKKWKDLQDGRNNRALTSIKATIFQDIPIEEWENHPDKADWDNQLSHLYKMDNLNKSVNDLKEGFKNILKSQDIDYSKYGIRVVQYPYGGTYGETPWGDKWSMPPGHIEAALYNKKTGELVNKIETKNARGHLTFLNTHINRWEGPYMSNFHGKGGNKELDEKRWKGDKNVRVADLDVDSDVIENFIITSQMFTETNMESINDSNPTIAKFLKKHNVPTALGTGPSEAYDFASSNCADGVCQGLGLDDTKYIMAGITDPTEVMDGILNDGKFNVVRKTGNRVSPRAGIKKIFKKEFDYDISGKSAQTISNFLDKLPKGTSEKLGFDLSDAFNKAFKNSKGFKKKKVHDQLLKDIYTALPDGTIPTAINVIGEEYVKPTIKALGELTKSQLRLQNFFKEGGEFPDQNNRQFKNSEIMEKFGGEKSRRLKIAQTGMETAQGQPQGNEQEQLMQQIAQALQEGAKPEEVLKQLVQMGLPKEQAVQIIQVVIQQLQGGQGEAPQQAQQQPPQQPQQGQPMARYGGEDIDPEDCGQGFMPHPDPRIGGCIPIPTDPFSIGATIGDETGTQFTGNIDTNLSTIGGPTPIGTKYTGNLSTRLGKKGRLGIRGAYIPRTNKWTGGLDFNTVIGGNEKKKKPGVPVKVGISYNQKYGGERYNNQLRQAENGFEPTSVISPEDREVVTKYDRQGREKKIITKRDKSQPRSEFNKRDVERIPLIERQRRQNAENPVFQEEDALPVHPLDSVPGYLQGLDSDALFGNTTTRNIEIANPFYNSLNERLGRYATESEMERRRRMVEELRRREEEASQFWKRDLMQSPQRRSRLQSQPWQLPMERGVRPLSIEREGGERRLRKAQIGVGKIAGQEAEVDEYGNLDPNYDYQTAQADPAAALFAKVKEGLSEESRKKGITPELILQNLIDMGMAGEQAQEFIKQAMEILNKEKDNYAIMLQQMQEQQDSLKNQYRRDVEELELKQGGGDPKSKFSSRKELTGAFKKMVSDGLSPQAAQAKLYNSNVVSEQDYHFVQGLVNEYKQSKKKKGGSTPVELTTKQIAQIMAAGGSVKYV